MKKKKRIDWKGIERDFRVGKTSIRQIAEWYEVSEGAIRRRAKAENWSQLVKPEQDEPLTFTRLTYVPPVQTQAEAKVIAEEGRDLAFQMLDELRATTSLRGELEEMIIAETSSDKDARRRKAMMRAVDLPERAQTLKALMLAAKTAAEVKKLEKADGEQPQPGAAPADDKPADDWDRLLN